MKELEELLQSKIEKVNILTIDENSILVVYVDVSHMQPSEVDQFCKKIQKPIQSVTKKRNADFLLIPQRNGKTITFEVIQKEAERKEI